MKLFIAASLLVCSAFAGAEVESSSATHYLLRHEGHSSLSPQALWDRLIVPSSWWSPSHSYSGDANNLSLDLRAGGVWLESWDGGEVMHGRVLLVQEPQVLRLEAPFGPLQGLGAYVVWTISLSADDEGTRVEFVESASGPVSANLEAIAPAVDGVKTEAMLRLTADAP